MKKQNRAFTLVELIVVITILAILGTIAFISLQGYSKSARDSKRVSNIGNIKTALEVFQLSASKYPIPDTVGTGTVSYSGELLWTQGTLGDNVTNNLSKTLQTKPLDPFFDIEYTYSTTSNRKEYQLLSLYENEISQINSNILNKTYAATTYNIKVEGTYNELFVKISSYIVPTPSIITSETLPLDLKTNAYAIDSMVVTEGTNIPDLGITNIEVSTGKLDINLSVYTGSLTSSSTSAEKQAAITAIQDAYAGTTLSTNPIYANVINTTDLVILADRLILNIYSTSSPIYKTVDDCVEQGTVIYGTEDGTDALLTCFNDIIICSGSGTGYTIAACNVGSNIVGTGTGSYGNYFQWGRNKGFPYSDTSQQSTTINGSIGIDLSSDTYGFVWGSDILQTWDDNEINIAENWGVAEETEITATYANSTTENQIKMKGPCKTGYHIPTYNEMAGLFDAGDGEGKIWNISGSTEATDIVNILKLPLAAYRSKANGVISNFGTRGGYWTSSIKNGDNAYNIRLVNGNITVNDYDGVAYGYPIRCMKN